MAGTKKTFKPSTLIVGILVAIWFLICLVPFAFLIMCTLKTQKEIMKNGVFSIPEAFNLSNYAEVFSGSIWHYFLNLEPLFQNTISRIFSLRTTSNQLML
jgi:raffinose/stachyose/melibiose transport system permease protein